MFPLNDENPTINIAWSTIAIILINLLTWVFIQGFGTDPTLGSSLCHYGLIPGNLLGNLEQDTAVRLSEYHLCTISNDIHALSLLSSMFMHGSWLHIIGNMWFLWVFGDNVEDIMGPGRFLIFYLLCGLGAAIAQILSNPDSVIPMVGASGAIGGVMGAYALLYPRAHVHTFVFLGFYATTVAVPAIFMLGYWFVLQILGAVPSLGAAGGGVAFWAHVGGFLTGIGLVKIFAKNSLLDAHRSLTEVHRSKHRLL
ncbi:MAG: rhomboid family intramembrane serine protease [Pseudomonadales bacterium]|nr:rhomboid family intramembrane serine protease [Pseudomonadales bacterium]